MEKFPFWQKIKAKNRALSKLVITPPYHSLKKIYNGITKRLPTRKAEPSIRLSRTSLSLHLHGWINHINYFDNFQGLGKEAFMTHGHTNGYLMDCTGQFRPADEVAKEVILPTLKKERRDTLTLLSCYGVESGAGQIIADIIGRKVRCFKGEISISQSAQKNLNLLEIPHSEAFFFKKEVFYLPTIKIFSMNHSDFCL